MTHKFWYCTFIFTQFNVLFCFLFFLRLPLSPTDSLKVCCFISEDFAVTAFQFDYTVVEEHTLISVFWICWGFCDGSGYGLSLNMISKSLSRMAFCCFLGGVFCKRQLDLVGCCCCQILLHPYYLVVLSVTERRVLKSSTVTGFF